MNNNNRYIKYKNKYINMKYNVLSGGGMEAKHEKPYNLIDIIGTLGPPTDQSHNITFPIHNINSVNSFTEYMKFTVQKFIMRAQKYTSMEEYNEIKELFDVEQVCINICYKTDLINILEKYKEIMNKIKYNLQKIIGSTSLASINWFEFNDTAPSIIKKLCIFREYIICIVIITAYRINDIMGSEPKKTNLTIYNTERSSKILLTPLNYFIINISGSDQLLSDIDININTLYNSSFWLAIIEDLIEHIHWFNHTKWRVDFYGDSISLIDFNQVWFPKLSYNSETYNKLLSFAIASYYKHDNSDTFEPKYFDTFIKIAKIAFDESLVNNTITEQSINIIRKLLNKIKDNKEKEAMWRNSRIITDNESTEKNDGQTYRESYYRALNILDDLMNKLWNKYFKLTTIAPTPQISESESESEYKGIIDKITLALANSNLYREENYLLIDSVIHIVKCMQDGNSTPIEKDIKTYSTFTNLPCDDLNDKKYILSALEQYGFMVHNIHLGTPPIICNLTINKYYNRILNALSSIMKINDSKYDSNKYKSFIGKLKDAIKISDDLINQKKTRSSTGDTKLVCDPPHNINLFESLNILINSFNEDKIKTNLKFNPTPRIKTQ